MRRGVRARRKPRTKPILLAISAVWCHWCHVMDETSYSDPEVIRTINKRFVPVRVDNDRRPDVNARYNMGGWPTTAFLAPDGTTHHRCDVYAAQRDAARARGSRRSSMPIKGRDRGARARNRGRRAAYAPAGRDELRESMVVRLVEESAEAFDAEYGGFGDAPKFPQPEMLDFLLSRVARDGRAAPVRNGRADDEGDVARRHVRPRRRRLLPVLDDPRLVGSAFRKDGRRSRRTVARARRPWLPRRNEAFRTTLVSAVGYVRDVLRDPETGFFAGSQDADEEYFALPLEERRDARGAVHGSHVVYELDLRLAGAWC